ncbi:WD repeat domain 90 [Perkinsus chesapeaki]|uniref:WD repeat domain 90 n=1 Tax=Perkinsus chesapeaki TaxID=330153 RepID=A0A7J6M6G3_PERCH|nr:WD repeat domain 90 [Perkinsus chesapeaki]
MDNVFLNRRNIIYTPPFDTLLRIDLCIPIIQLPAPVYGLDLTPDDLHLLCSVGDGSVGVLDLESCKYTVVSRSHKSKIRSATLSSCGTKLCTAACDGSVRVWEIDNGIAKTLVEFKAESDTPSSLAFQPPCKIDADEVPLLAVGFASGAVMLFEISPEGEASPIVELKQHAHPVTSISFASVSPATVLLLTGDATGRIVVHDEARNFEATRCPDPVVSKPILPVVPAMESPQEVQVQPQTFVVRPGRVQEMIALYSHERCIALAQLPEFEPLRMLRIGQHQSAAAAITAYTFSADGALLMVGLSDSWIRIFDPETGMLEHSINCVMSGMITALYMSSILGDSDVRKILTAGHLDNQLRISDYYRDVGSMGLDLMGLWGHLVFLHGSMSYWYRNISIWSLECLTEVDENLEVFENFRPEQRTCEGLTRSQDPLHRPNEQSYHAHHYPPRTVFAVGQLLITVSNAEVCLWECPDPGLSSAINRLPLRELQDKPPPAQNPTEPRGEMVVVEGRGLFQSVIEEENTAVPESQKLPEILEENCEPEIDDVVEVARLDTGAIVEEVVTKKAISVERSEAAEKIKYKRFCGGGAAVLWLSELGHLATGCHRWVHLCNLVEDRDSYLMVPEKLPGPNRVTSLDLSPLTMRTLLALADDGRWMIAWDLAKAGLAYSSQDECGSDKGLEFVEPLSVTRLTRVGTACKLLADSLAVSCARSIADQEGNVAQITVWGLPRAEPCAEAKVLTTANLQLPDASGSGDEVQIVVNPLSAMEFVTMTSDSIIMWQLASSEIDENVCGWGLAFNEVPLPEQHTSVNLFFTVTAEASNLTAVIGSVQSIRDLRRLDGNCTLSSISISPPHLFIGTTTGFVIIIDCDQCELLTAVSVISNSKPPSFTKIAPLPIPSKASIFTCLVTTEEDKLQSVEICKDLLGTWEAKLDPHIISFSEPIGSIQFYGSSNEGVVVTEGSASTDWFVDWDKRARARLRAMVPRSPVGLDSRNNLLAVANTRDLVVYRTDEHGRIEGLTRYREARSEAVTIRCVAIISSDDPISAVVGLSDGRARVYNLNPEKGQADYIQLDVFREVPLTAVAAFCGRRVLVGSGTGVLAWTVVPTVNSQAARLSRLASAPAKDGIKPCVMQISVAPGGATFCASLSRGQLWAGCVRKQPAIRCVMQSTWTVRDLRASVCLSQGRVACCSSTCILLYKIGTPVPVWTQSLEFPPSLMGRLGCSMIVVDGDGPKLTPFKVEEDKGQLAEDL